ncbi:hypothetical protein [Prevotella sp. MA2016]|uniref:hypothetical protein n=1 Tax=Prevotella sp. MA2016 TaxID=1408310 RepID=UPI00048B2F02|nr:hypothetical protein [Prevotella sp. MA2016]
MKTTTDYKFDVCISDQTFDHKPNRDTEVPKLTFHQSITNVEGLVNAVSKGHCYAPIFEQPSIDMYHKHAKDFRYSYFISIDVDHNKVEMNSMIDNMEYKPTFAYTSCSNGENGEYSYRLVYCFSEKIEGVDEYYSFVYAIMTSNGLAIKDIDYRCREAERYYNGNGCGNIEPYITNIIYDKEDYKDYYKQYHRPIEDKSVNENHTYNNNYNIHLNDTFENDYRNMKMEDILAKYIDVFPNIEHTPLEIPDDDTPYIIYPIGHTEIRRWWRKRLDGKPIKIKDGEGRRRKLFINGIIRRLINPNITFDNLLYNLLYELVYYMSNYDADNVIDKKVIYNIATDVMNKDMAKYERLRGTHKKFMVNPNFCIKYGLSKNEVKNIAAKMIRHNQIGELYDCSKTDKKNIEIMKENGLDISISTLKRWRKENGIAKYKS